LSYCVQAEKDNHCSDRSRQICQQGAISENFRAIEVKSWGDGRNFQTPYKATVEDGNEKIEQTSAFSLQEVEFPQSSDQDNSTSVVQGDSCVPSPKMEMI